MTLDLALGGVKRLDPAYMANRAPLYQWAKAVWKEPWKQAHKVMKRALNEAMCSFGGAFLLGEDVEVAPHLDGREKTPGERCAEAGAVIATLERIWESCLMDCMGYGRTPNNRAR